jgi:hypothetical protein
MLNIGVEFLGEFSSLGDPKKKGRGGFDSYKGHHSLTIFG